MVLFEMLKSLQVEGQSSKAPATGVWTATPVSLHQMLKEICPQALVENAHRTLARSQLGLILFCQRKNFNCYKKKKKNNEDFS